MSDQLIGVISGAAHLVLSFVLALVATYGSFRIFDKLTHDIDEVNELKANNIAVSITLAGMLLSSAMIMKAVVHPAISTVQTYLYQGVTAMTALKLAGLMIGYIIMAIFLAIATVWIAIRCFLGLTRKIDEFEQVKKNNIAVAITLSVVIVIMAMFLSDGIGSLLRALIPFPAFEEIKILGG